MADLQCVSLSSTADTPYELSVLPAKSWCNHQWCGTQVVSQHSLHVVHAQHLVHIVQCD